MLGDRARVDPGSARQADAAFRELFARELVGASADRLDKLEPPGALQQAVAPQPRDYQHIGLVELPVERVEITRFEARNAGVLNREPLLQPVCDMREADREFVT